MVDVPSWLEHRDTSPLLLATGLALGGAVILALVTEGLPSGRAAGPLALAAFVLAMLVVDRRRRN